ncbi:MAG: ABC transporter ATP-binding protein, partial [Defluviitaleaceae bacterium]|nr:ABC transporter ATP-binding protein [Defluviitaleaceae bacterium]
MLHMNNICKNYEAGGTVVEALKDIELKFRSNEFVSVLGPSGCGKTTMLNLLGGLDRYTSGDLIINGKSTKDFTDREWDTYRNRRVGFVFQNYHLIPHQSVFRNVELALTLSGVSKAERRRRAMEVLDKVGLSDQLHKRPNQMSGGQMQRVSIARALINNPDILLADEPTGALDSGTSEQIMALIKEIANERLVIMVTHNAELAKAYSTRIIKLFDGRLVGDDDVFETEDARVPAEKKKKKKGEKKTSMSFLTALSLSANNLLTKKTRTFMTSFAGSIGIIGIALILALSSGSQAYIDRVQEDTLSTYPITIEERTTDIGALMSAMRDIQEEAHSVVREDDGRVYSHDIMGGMIGAMVAGREDNDLKSFKQHIENNREKIEALTNDVTYGYNIRLNIYAADHSNGIKQVNPFELLRGMNMGGMGMGMLGGSTNIWSQIMENPTLLNTQYDVVAGRWPSDKSEVVLVIDERNEIIDYSLYAMGLKETSEVQELMRAMREGRQTEGILSGPASYSYEELLGLRYKLVPNADFYGKDGDAWNDMRGDEEYMKQVLDDALELRVVGIVRPNENTNSASITGTLGYTKALTEYIIERANASEIVRLQKADESKDVFTGKPFADPNSEPEPVDLTSLSPEMTAYLATLSDAERESM